METGLARRARSLKRCGKFRNMQAQIDRFLNMVARRIVMAGQHDTQIVAGLGNRPAMLARMGLRLRVAAQRERIQLGIAHLGLALIIDLVGIEAGKLTLPRRVVHQRGQPHQRIVLHRQKAFETIGSRNPQRRWI